MDPLLSMRIYRRVVELRGFSAAARDLRVSNAAVSKAVAALEARLAVRLLERTTRRVAVTPAGESYYARCARILDDIEEAEQEASESSRVPKGRLRVNAPVSFGLLHLAPLVPELLARHPGMKVELSLDDRFVDLVAEGVDVAVRIASALPDSSSLVARRLASTRLVVCGSPSYFRKHGKPKTPEDLTRHEAVTYSLGRERAGWHFEGPNGEWRVPVRGGLEINNSIAIRDAVVAGHGITFLPLFYVEPLLRTKKLVEVLADHPRKPLHVHAVHVRKPHVSTRVRVFVELLRERYGSAPWATRDAGAAG